MPRGKAQAAAEVRQAVAWYQALNDLFISNPESGVAPVAAFRAGDQVSPELVESQGWWDQVRVPEVFGGGEQPVGSPDAPVSPDEGTDGDAPDQQPSAEGSDTSAAESAGKDGG